MVGAAADRRVRGGGFSMEAGNPLLDDYVLSADAASSGRGSASCRPRRGDADHYVVRFYRAFSPARCEPSHVSLFRRDKGAGVDGDLAASTCSTRTSSTSAAAASSRCSASGARTASTRCCAEAWRARRRAVRPERRLAVLVPARRSPRSTAAPTPVAGLGLLPHSNCVHYDGEPARREAYRAARRRRRCRPGYARRRRRRAALRRHASSRASSSSRRERARLPRRGRRRRGVELAVEPVTWRARARPLRRLA